MLPRFLLSCTNSTPSLISVRNAGLRSPTMRGRLKDLYNRRQLIGADPVLHRSAQVNWNYGSELAAFRHRINVPELEDALLQHALTNSSFLSRADVSEGATESQPAMEEATTTEVNDEFAAEGSQRVWKQLAAILRAEWPAAPEEYIESAVENLLSLEVLEKVANHLGLQHLVRTGEFPVERASSINGLMAVVGVINPDRVHRFVCEFILPNVMDMAVEEVLPYALPLPILEDYLRKEDKSVVVEPRILHTSGVNHAFPLYRVGIYANQRLVGDAPGEQLCVAVDMAATDALLKLWGVHPAEQTFSAVINSGPSDKAFQPNHRISTVVSKGRDLSLLSVEERLVDPIDITQVVTNYHNNIYSRVGLPLRRRQRHFFSRGSLAARSYRYMVVPRPYTI